MRSQAEDPQIAGILLSELDRLRGGLQLIASENFTSPAVLAALGSTLSNKYAEGYPGRRYYGGCAEVDKAEIIGIERAKELFGAEHANLQPHSGASANIAAYGAFVKPGDTVLAMSLPHGGHLTHGSKVNFSGKWFNIVSYGVRRDTELIDYDEVLALAKEHRPKMIICGATAYPRLIDFAAFRGHRRRGRGDPHGRRRAFHRAGRGQGDPQPGAVRRCRHLHDPQGPARPPRWHDHLQGGTRQGHRQGRVPDDARGSADACGRRQGGGAERGCHPGVPGLRRQVIDNAQALAESLAQEGMRPVSGGTDTHLALIDLQGIGVTGAEAEDPVDAAGITLNKNAIPYDPQPPSIGQRHPGRHPVRHHPGHGHGRDEGDRFAHRSGGADADGQPRSS